MYAYIHAYSLFQEEISACAAVHARYAMDAYGEQALTSHI